MKEPGKTYHGSDVETCIYQLEPSLVGYVTCVISYAERLGGACMVTMSMHANARPVGILWSSLVTGGVYNARG